ncbi:serine/threonine-protein kinase [Paraliomyxa miuraensis]|uniref:serine/threonine-protein kinase n=1 Tax=Paraliomyxa miuraensis TaxID=376150 RepID=UPI002258AAF3|nr:serine/threonine-protein kinase [Paraliomyxa miuraensis]MCX4243569.1 tetratricopeptide repeat protein [Paraliomyxa miuraensis]
MDDAATGSELDPDERTAFMSPDGTPDDTGAPTHAGSRPRPLPEPDIGTMQGRYVVLETLGRGAMGRVLRAYDPKLQREVALKLVLGKVLDANARERMLREAQAMAQLSHPNVVAVFDVEELQAGLVLVMEYVPGQTLRRWSRSGGRRWDEVVAHYRKAGRGLAAAHAAGLLHRDFKPDNVLIDDAGGVKVTDFGLAKLSATETRSSIGESLDSVLGLDGLGLDGVGQPSEASGSGSIDVVLTQLGTVMGTPRYMPPEQHRGEPLEPSADQFAFCLSLWEALCGAPPFRSKELTRLYGQKQAGPPAWPSGSPPVPRPVIEAVRRGLSPEPVARWPSMEALLEALDHDPAKRRRQWLWGLGGGALVVAAVAGWWSWSSARAQQCSGARERLAGVWDEARREQAREAMLGVGASFAGPVWERTAGQLDRYADEWVAMHTEACEATTVRGEQSATVMDLRMACLHRARVELSAVTQVLAGADVEVTRNAADVVGGLPRLSRCADVEALMLDVEPPPPEEAAAVEEIRARLAEAISELRAGRFDQALARAEEARGMLAGIAYEPVVAEVALDHGVVLEELGRYAESEAALREGLRSAARFRRLDLVQELAEELMFVVGYQQRRMDEGRQLWELTLGLSLHDPVVEASAHNAYANVLAADGELAEAEAEYRRALQLREQALPPDDPELGISRSNLGLCLYSQGRYEESETELRRAVTAMEKALGPDHPTVGLFHNNLANTLSGQGRYEEAEAEIRRAMEVQEAALGPDHPDVAMAYNNLAQVLNQRGDHAGAEAQQREAIRRQERGLGAGHPDIAQSYNNLGNVLYAQGRYVEAEAELRRALPMLEAALGPEHAIVAQSRSNLGLVLHEQGRDDEAEAELRGALAQWERSLGLEHPNVGIARNNLALVLYSKDRYDEAEAEYRRVIANWEASLGAEHPNMATAYNNLSQVLIEQGKLEEAEHEQRRALAITTAAVGPEHADVARSRNNLAQLLLDRGQPEAAELEARSALALWERTLGAEHPNVAIGRHTLAKVLLARGRTAEAVALAEQALQRRLRDDALPDARAGSAFLLARALWQGGGAAERARARTLAQQAEEGFGEASADEAVADVRAWLLDPGGWRPRGPRQRAEERAARAR